MSVKRIIAICLTLTILSGFTVLGLSDTIKRKDKLEFQQIEIKSQSTEIKELNIKYDELNKSLDEASRQKDTNQQQIKQLHDEKQNLEKQKQDLEKQLQAKLEQKSRLAAASNSIINAATGSSAASAKNGGSVKDIITAAGNKYGVSNDYMLSMAFCESAYDPNAINRYHVIVNGVDYGPARGLYQFLDSTWARMSTQAGLGGASVFDSTANAEVFAWAITHGHSGEWECKA